MKRPGFHRDSGRFIGGFGVQPGEAPTTSDTVDLRDEPTTPGSPPTPLHGAQGEPSAAAKTRTRRSKSPKAQSQDESKKEMRRRLIATLTPSTKELLTVRTRESQESFGDVLIDAWLSHREGVAQENQQDDDQSVHREELGVRPLRHKRPSGRSDAQFYLTEREHAVIQEGATLAGYKKNRSAYIEAHLVRELVGNEAAGSTG